MPHTVLPIRWTVSLVLAMLASAPGHAGVFHCKTASGATVFQDSPCLPGSEAGQKPKAETVPAVDLTQPLEKRFKSPEEKARLEAALKIMGLQRAMKASVAYCDKYSAEHAASIQRVVDTWQAGHAVALQNSTELVEQFTTSSERVADYQETSDLMARALSLRSEIDPARNLANCQAAPAKLRSFLSNRFAEAYGTVVSKH